MPTWTGLRQGATPDGGFPLALHSSTKRIALRPDEVYRRHRPSALNSPLAYGEGTRSHTPIVWGWSTESFLDPWKGSAEVEPVVRDFTEHSPVPFLECFLLLRGPG